MGFGPPASSPIPHTKVWLEHQPPSNVSPASSALPGRRKALGNWAAMSVVGAEHLWKRKDSPSSQGGTSEGQLLPGCHVHLSTPSPAPGSQRAPAGSGASCCWFLHLSSWWPMHGWLESGDLGGHSAARKTSGSLDARCHLQEPSPLGQSHDTSSVWSLLAPKSLCGGNCHMGQITTVFVKRKWHSGT